MIRKPSTECDNWPYWKAGESPTSDPVQMTVNSAAEGLEKSM